MEFSISNYLKKFEQFLPHETKVRNATIRAVHEVVGVSLERAKIKVSGGSVFIQGSAALRSEIGLKQAKILARMKEIDPGLKIEKIL